jgi:hypothetical protein
MLRALRVSGIVLCLVLAGSVVAWAQSGVHNSCLCERDEARYFSCQTARGKSIALCGSGDRFVQYRFGKRGKIELRFPTSGASPETLRYANFARFETENYEVTFESLGAHYAVFDYTEGNEHSAGVRVNKSSGQEVLIKCSSRIYSRLSQLESRLPCDRDNALNMGGCPQKAE